MSRPKKVPHAANAVVEEKKVVSYLLNLDHKEGGSKAKFFLKRGFATESWETFATALARHAQTQPVINVESTEFGMKYQVECQLETPDKINPCILSVWIIEDETPPRLVTAHPNS